MTNTINFPASLTGLDVNEIERSLPFEYKTVWIWSVAKAQTGYGHWLLTVDIEIDGERHTLRSRTTDSRLIDRWGDDEHADGEGRFDAVYYILANNQDELIEIVEFINE